MASMQPAILMVMAISITPQPLILIRPIQSQIQKQFRSLRILLSPLTSRSLMLVERVQLEPSTLQDRSSSITSSSPTTAIQPSPASPLLIHSLAPTSLLAPWLHLNHPPFQIRPTPPHKTTSILLAVVMAISITPPPLILIKPIQSLTQKKFQSSPHSVHLLP